MNAPEPTPPPPLAARLRRFGQRALAAVLAGILALWLHEFFVEAADPKGWKLLVLLPLILLGVGGTLALLIAAAVDWRARGAVSPGSRG
jgi:hypothetical protein